jgi:hypothetical protein
MLQCAGETQSTHPANARLKEANMKWPQVRTAYPDQWLVIEALEAHTEDRQRILDRIAVIETCSSGKAAMDCYRQLHREYPLREFYFVHTSRDTLEIVESLMDYARDINGILGMNFLLRAGAVIDLRQLTMEVDMLGL